jgi:hypothetical protein
MFECAFYGDSWRGDEERDRSLFGLGSWSFGSSNVGMHVLEEF